jgi:hypothetical protein
MADVRFMSPVISLPLITMAWSCGLFADDSPISGQITGNRGCRVKYEYYQPDINRTATAVILAHGFKRNLTRMRGWARQWSELGIPVIIPTLCSSSWLRGRHEENAVDLVSLREQLKIDQVIYAGFSAGGLASYLAAGLDPATRAYAGLDPVDSGKLAINAATRLDVPALFLLAGSSRCNRHNNFLPVIEGMETARLHQFDEATHCHFERPYDRKCSWACGKSDEATTRDQQAAISEAITSWLLDQLGLGS